ncbi:AAA family ATPase [Ochrobactrum teleogrylli]|uniref:DNA transposition protein n=1 Tax=Ochrobactrum teleogrylli TaxID=2479765 RepID=A0ABY2Y7Q0_9HYPH|nr:AAA family ATPase [[Ochrobactrum] teleogrylli]TNV17765.1 DNA transposition protein [[Ochrobactrum] teleogrylli]
MKDVNNTTSNKNIAWSRPSTQPELSGNRSQTDIDIWWSLVDRVREIATRNEWPKAEVARRVGMADSTFSLWYSGKYPGRLDIQNVTVQQWLDALDDAAELSALPTSPAFFKTRTSDEIMDALKWAQVQPELVMITIGAGMGKTMTCRHYRATRPHTYMVTMSPHTKTVNGMLVDLAAELDVIQHNPAKLTRAIGNRLGRSSTPTLLIVDEAQNLQDEAINQLRHFVDVFNCGVALVGNDEIHSRFAKRADGPSHAQLKSRIGKRLRYSKPIKEDLQAFISAWGVTEPESVKFLLGIGMKGGALRQIDKTMKLASMVALGAGEEVSFQFIKAAWENRDVEDLV